MSTKEKDPEAIKRKFSNKPIDYVKLNKLYEDFGKRFIPQQELSTDEAFWYHMLNPFAKSSDALPIIKEAPKELPKSNTKVFTMTMEILLEPTSNKLLVERFNTTAGNPVKEILLKLNLPDHRYTYRWTRRYLVLPDSQDL
nr:hypothetical protein [Tanacetum cinerariifolium]